MAWHFNCFNHDSWIQAHWLDLAGLLINVCCLCKKKQKKNIRTTICYLRCHLDIIVCARLSSGVRVHGLAHHCRSLNHWWCQKGTRSVPPGIIISTSWCQRGSIKSSPPAPAIETVTVINPRWRWCRPLSLLAPIPIDIDTRRTCRQQRHMSV